MFHKWYYVFWCTAIVITLIHNVRFYIEHFKIVQTSIGPVRGLLHFSFLEYRPYYSFKGIPYARPPVHQLRFLPPRPVEPWHVVRDCFEFGNFCLQENAKKSHEIIGDEDCLTLNIYTPDHEPSSGPLRAVMIYIHGGAWYMGGSDEIEPDFLINENVVFVTFNYRLGVLGFMSLGSAEYSGMQGLKDQQLVLRWVKQNIQQFGGDPNRITIFGDSAGSVSSQFHILAPGSRDLFHRSIEISFTFDIWKIFAVQNHRSEMFNAAKKLNHTVYTYDELVQFLQTYDPYKISELFPFKMFYNPVIPTIERADAFEPFLSGSPADLMLYTDKFKTNVDVMTGFTTGETLFLDHRKSKVDKLLENFQVKFPNIHFNEKYNSSQYKSAADRIYKYYFRNDSTPIESFIELESDVRQRYFIDRRIKTLAEKSEKKTFYYRFGLNTRLNFFKRLARADNHPGASHGDDLCYVYKCNFTLMAQEMYYYLTRESTEYGLIKLMSGLYANFAKYGNPLITDDQLSPVKPGKYTFLDITNEGISIGEDPFKEKSEFWNSLMDDHKDLLTLHT